MSPLLLGAAWILFVVSCVASMAADVKAKPPVKSVKKVGGRDEKTI